MGILLVVLGTVAVLMVWGSLILKIAYMSEKVRVMTPAMEEAKYCLADEVVDHQIRKAQGYEFYDHPVIAKRKQEEQ